MYRRSGEEGSEYSQNIFGKLIRVYTVIRDSCLVSQVCSVYDDKEVLEVSETHSNGQSNLPLVADVILHSAAAEARKRKVVFIQAYRQHPFRCDASQGKS